jgi:general secretion pathway protein F
MTTFTYKAIPAGAGGAMVTGALDAPSADTVRATLRDKGLIVIELKSSKGLPAFSLKSRKSALKRKDVVWFFQTLRRLLASSVPIEQAMSTMVELAPTPGAERACTTTLDSLRTGDSLADAVQRTSGLARPQHLALLRVGHESGRLRHCVELIESSIESRERLRKTIVSKLTYPVIVVLAALGAVLFLSTYVIPSFAETLESAGAALPLSTQITLDASRWLIWIIPPLILAGLAALTLKPQDLSPNFRRLIDRSAHRLPIVRDLITLSQGAIIVDTVATMLEGGGDLLAGLEQAHDAITSPIVRDRLAQAVKAVREGHDPGEALHENDVLPLQADALVRIGVRSGDLVNALKQAAAVCIEEQEQAADRLLTLMGPVILLSLALVVLWIVYSLISGMMSINDISALG